MLIVTYHAVAGPASPVCCPPDQLEADLRALQAARFTFVSLDDCADWLAGRRELPSRSIAVTFDDAYESVILNALPILTRYSVAATIFVIGERIGGDNRWPGQWKSIPPMRLASLGQLKDAVAAGTVIGSHSWSHPVLSALDDSALASEVGDSARKLEDVLGAPIRHFAYPYGIRGRREIEAAGRGYRTAVNAEPRPVRRGADAHDLCRLDCHDLRFALSLKLFDDTTVSPYLAFRRTLRGGRRRLERIFGQT